MVKDNRRSGALRSKINVVGFAEVDDGDGGTKLEFDTIATVDAGFKPLRGGEQVMASRLAGKAPYIVTIRSSALTRTITPAHQLQDARDTSRMFDIKAISDPDNKGAWLEILAEQVVT